MVLVSRLAYKIRKKDKDMKNWSEKMSEALMPVAQKISGNRYLSAVKEGFFGAMPILIVGSLFLLFTSLA